MLTARTYTVGEAKIARITDCQIDSFTPASLMPEWDARLQPRIGAMPEAMAPDGEHVRLSIHSWIIWLGGKILLVDTGASNNKPRPDAPYFHQLKTAYLENMAALGVTPDIVDYVLHTHLHVDHVGWNTQLIDGKWQPTFPNARYIFSAKEYAFFSNPAQAETRHRTSFRTQQDSITPVIRAGLADMITIDGSEAIPHFRFHSTPGHSADHASIVMESAGEKAIFSGDVFHHPIQVFTPHLLSVFDPERERALKSRLRVLDYAADQKAKVFSAHFAASGAGTVSKNNEEYSWTFI